MPELVATLDAKRTQDHEHRKFLAALKGIDLDAQSSEENGKVRGQQEWEDLKARVFSRGATSNSNDIISLQGANAQKVGFGIGMGLEYAVVKDPVRP